MLHSNILNIVLLGVLALGGLLLVALVGLLALQVWFGGCSDEGKAIVEEFPHYGDRRIEPYSGEASCNVRYPTEASREEVLAYYEEQLRENGWEVMGFWAADPPKGIEHYGEDLSDVSGAPESVGGGLGSSEGNTTTGLRTNRLGLGTRAGRLQQVRRSRPRLRK